MIFRNFDTPRTRLKNIANFIYTKLIQSQKDDICRNCYSTTSSYSANRILFLGSDEFSIKSFDAVTSSIPPPVSISVVVSNFNNLLGKHVQRIVNSGCSSFSLQLVLWKEFKEGPPSLFDLGIVSSFGHLIPSKVIQQCQLGILNVHGSLLPRWRGAAPTAASILHHDTVTGISIMKIAPHRFDIGDILYQVQATVDPHIRTPELTSQLAIVGADALKHVLSNLNFYLSTSVPQNESEATKGPKLTTEMSYIKWNEMDSVQIYNLFRALSGRYKLKTKYHHHIVDLDDISIHKSQYDSKGSQFINYYGYSTVIDDPTLSQLESSSCNLEPGEFFYSKQQFLVVKCKSNSWIFIRKIKIKQNWITARDFQNGWLSKTGAVMCFKSLEIETKNEVPLIKAKT